MPISATYALPADANAWLKHESNFELTRRTITLKSGAGNLVSGTVLGMETSSSKYLKHVNGASDGTETAAAILLFPVDASSADQKAVVIWCDAVINPLALTWDTSVNTQGKKNAALAQLDTKRIVTRSVV